MSFIFAHVCVFVCVAEGIKGDGNFSIWNVTTVAKLSAVQQMPSQPSSPYALNAISTHC